MSVYVKHRNCGCGVAGTGTEADPFRLFLCAPHERKVSPCTHCNGSGELHVAVSGMTVHDSCYVCRGSGIQPPSPERASADGGEGTD